MDEGLITEVVAGLAARKGAWKRIANDLPGISYSWIAQLGRGKYKSEPSYKRLRAVAEYLRAEKKAA